MQAYYGNVILVNDNEKNYLSNHGFDANNIVIDRLTGFRVDHGMVESRNLIKGKLVEELRLDPKCKIVLFHGLPNIISNIMTFREICHNIAPRVKVIDKGVVFILAGGNLDGICTYIGCDNIISIGYLESRSKLYSYLISADLYIAPMEIGSGVKTKILDAMSAGAPILTTKFVKDEFSGDPPFLLSNISEFPTKIIESLSDENLLKSLREKTLDYVNKYNHENSDHEYFLNAIDHLTKIELKK